jgi:type VII secretion protein EccB
MASRRDELRAHQFLKQRAVSALVVQQTDPEQPPFRRPSVAAWWSLALALLGLTVAGVLGLFTHKSSPKLEAGKTVIVEKGTGARFVFLNGRLEPVANYVSALLILGDHVGTQNLASSVLAGVPRGPAVGIAGAPDELPDGKHLLSGGWTMCSQPSISGSGGRIDRSVLLVGQRAAGGAAAGDRAVLVEVAATGRQYLIWHGYRHEIADPRAVSVGLALANEASVPVASAWVDVLPAGPMLAPIAVPGSGGPSRALLSRPETLAGQLFVVPVSDTVRQYYLAQATRLMPITPFQLNVQLAATATRAAYPGHSPQPIRLDPAEITLADQSIPASTASDLPRDRPAFISSDSPTASACAAFDDAGTAVPSIVVGATVPPESAQQATPGRSATGAPLADSVVVPAGHAALVSVVANGKAATGTLALVTDAGRLFPLASADVPKILGFAGMTPARVPAVLAARLPQGPALDPAQARQPP